MFLKFYSILNLSDDGATSSILILDDFYVLLGKFLNLFIFFIKKIFNKDCGINESLDINKYLQNTTLLNKIDLILLSHPGYEYCGALAFISSLLTNKVYFLYFFILFTHNNYI